MKSKIIFLVALMMGIIISLQAQQIIKKDIEIDAMVKEISVDTLSQNLNKLVSFGTRATLSNQSSASKGIGAARAWILSRFNDYAKSSNGRLTAFIDTITYNADKRRVDRPIDRKSTRLNSSHT